METDASSTAFGGRLPTPGYQNSSLHNCEALCFCCKPPRVWYCVTVLENDYTAHCQVSLNHTPPSPTVGALSTALMKAISHLASS
jgi:hypothetical protein